MKIALFVCSILAFAVSIWCFIDLLSGNDIAINAALTIFNLFNGLNGINIVKKNKENNND